MSSISGNDVRQYAMATRDLVTLAALESVVRGHHSFKQVWTPIHGLCLTTSVVDTKKYPLNSEYALNNEVRLTTGVYSIRLID